MFWPGRVPVRWAFADRARGPRLPLNRRRRTPPAWEVADWEDVPPLRILHYRGKRRTTPGQKGTYKELFSVTLENKGGSWVVTKYDSMY